MLDRGEITAELASQAAQAERAQSQARDLQQGARPSELNIARESVRAAQADLELAQISFDRTDKLAKSDLAAPAELDRARAELAAAKARAAGAQEQLRLQEEGYRRPTGVRRQPGRDRGAGAARGRAQPRERTGAHRAARGRGAAAQLAPGELVPPCAPVLTLGDPDSLWMRVYVAAPLLPLRLGAAAEVRPIGVKRRSPAAW